MDVYIRVIAFLFGLLFGSFYNVVVYRAPLELSIAKGRSFCPNCKTKLKPLDLIPLFSQLFLRNRCRYCKEKISLRYPAVELLTGCLFLLAVWKWGLTWECFLHLVFWSMLLITTLIDLDHMIIIDQILLAGSLGAVIYMIFAPEPSVKTRLIGMTVGFGIYLLIYLVARAAYGQEAFGFGDVLLMGSIGLFLGLPNTILTCILSFFIALAVILLVKIAGKKVSRKREFPFGPFICAAAFVSSLFGSAIIEAYLNQFM